MSAKPSDDVQTSLRWVSGAKVQQKSHSCKRNAIFIIERSIFSLVNASVALLFRVRTWKKIVEVRCTLSHKKMCRWSIGTNSQLTQFIQSSADTAERFLFAQHVGDVPDMWTTSRTNQTDTESIHHNTYAILLLSNPRHNQIIQSLC